MTSERNRTSWQDADGVGAFSPIVDDQGGDLLCETQACQQCSMGYWGGGDEAADWGWARDNRNWGSLPSMAAVFDGLGVGW